jgi:hypothetical protein
LSGIVNLQTPETGQWRSVPAEKSKIMPDSLPKKSETPVIEVRELEMGYGSSQPEMILQKAT